MPNLVLVFLNNLVRYTVIDTVQCKHTVHSSKDSILPYTTGTGIQKQYDEIYNYKCTQYPGTFETCSILLCITISWYLKTTYISDMHGTYLINPSWSW